MTSSAPGAPAATERLRRDNTALVLRVLREGGSASRATLAQRAGLAKATVGAIIAELIALGAVREVDATPAQPGRAGRPGRPVELHGADLVGLGLEVNVDYLAATALDLSGHTVLSTQRAAASSSLTDLISLARRARAQLEREGRRLLGTTVAVPGRVDRERGLVAEAPNLHWRDLDVVSGLSTVLPGPVRVDNDANCAAIGERSFGAARGAEHVLYLTGTVGIGAGLLSSSGIVRGAHGAAGEVGHAPLGDPTLVCACGRNGCWETAVGLNALLTATGVVAAGAAKADPVAVAEAIAGQAGAPAVRAGLERVAAALASGVATLTATLDPELIVLGGSFVPLGRWLLPAVTAALSNTSSRVVLSTLGLHAASAGAAADVLADLYAADLPLPPPATSGTSSTHAATTPRASSPRRAQPASSTTSA